MNSVRRPGPPFTRAAVAVAVGAALLVAACSGTGGDGDAASTTEGPATTGPAETSLPLPAEAFDDVTTDTLGTPNPPLPGDIRPEAFPIGTLGALGNIQIQVVGVEQPGTDPTAPETLKVRLKVTNGSLDDLEVRRASFSVYLADGSAVPANDDSGTGVVDRSLASAETAEGELTFTLPPGARPIMMLFDSAGYGDRIYSGAFVVGT